MIDIKIGETYTTPGGVVIRAKEQTCGCDNCEFYGLPSDLRIRAGVGCTDMVCLHPPRIFAEVPKTENVPVRGGVVPRDEKRVFGCVVPVPTLSGMDEAFQRHVLSVARAEFVALFWDMPNTDLAAAMGVTEKTVRNIRKKRLRKNKESI